MKVFRSMVLDASIDRVWPVVRQFDGVVKWHPGVAMARMEEGAANTEIGGIRHLTLPDGGVIRETLLTLDDVGHAFCYDIIDSPLPVTNYLACQRFFPVTHSRQTYASWEVSFDTDQPEAMEGVIGDDIFIGGLIGLNNFLKG